MNAADTTAGTNRIEFRNATRVLTSVLAPIEKRTLVWLAHRMPRWVNSDHLTALALAAMLMAGLSYWLASVTPVGLLLVVVCLAVNWFGDSLDGTLARVRDQQRPRYGFYVDHVVDIFGVLFLLGGLGLSGHMSLFVALGLLVAYMMLCVETFLATYTRGTFTMSYFSLGPTELRIMLAIGNLAVLAHPTAEIFGYQFRLFDVGGVVAIAGLLFTLVFAAARNGRALYLAEPIPGRAAGR
ncbi:MAG: CDP-alcohol phosphatidyltransferase family protein [Vicinamibacterales bacterium]